MLKRASLLSVRTFFGSYRMFCQSTDTTKAIEDKIKNEFQPTSMLVVDHSGGCPGGTLEVEIHSTKFQAKSELQRHRMVVKLLKSEIEGFHAFVLRTIPTSGDVPKE